MNVTFPQEILCFGGLGKISINPNGGGGAPYKISWEILIDETWTSYTDGDNDPKVLSNIAAGKYKATVSDKDDNEFKSEIIVSFRYILSPVFNSRVSVLTMPEIAPTIPTSCFSIFNVSVANELTLIKNNKLKNIVKIFFITKKFFY